MNAFVVVGAVWFVSGILTYLLVKDYDLMRWDKLDTAENWHNSLGHPSRCVVFFGCLFGPYGTFVVLYFMFFIKILHTIVYIIPMLIKNIYHTIAVSLEYVFSPLFSKGKQSSSFLSRLYYCKKDLLFIPALICFQILKLVPFGVLILGFFPDFFDEINNPEYS